MNRFTKKIRTYLPITYLFRIAGIYVFFCFYFFLSATDEESNAIDISEFYSVFIILGLIAIIIWIISIVYAHFYYKTSSYELTENEIICVRGVLFKKKSIIEYKNIHAVNQKQGLIQRLFNISVLMVDSGSTNTSTTAEVMIYEDKNVVEQLLYKLKNIDQKQDVDTVNSKVEKTYLYKFSSVRKLIYSVLNVIGSLIWMAIIFIVIIVVYLFIGKNIEDGITFIDLILVLIGSYFVINGFVLIFQIAYSFISLHDFHVTLDKDSLNINYGLFTKINNTFKLDRIKGVKIEQGLIKRLFGFATVKLEVIGYDHYSSDSQSNDGNDVFSSGLLIPLCKLSEVNNYLAEILPNYIPLERDAKAKSFKVFMTMPTLITGVVLGVVLLCVAPLFLLINDPLMIVLIICSFLLVFLILELSYFVNALFKFRQQSVAINDEKITIYSGGITHIATVIKKENLIAIEDVTTYHQAKKNIYTYLIHFHTNALTNVIKVEYLDLELKDKLLNLLKY